MSLPDARLCRPTSPRCWPACRCETGLTGPSLAMGLPKIHGTRTMAPPPAARGGSLCPVTACPASNLPLPITTEKREARTAGLGCAGLSSERKGFSRSCFRPSPPCVYACTSCSPILRRATSTHLVPVRPTTALYLFETLFSARHHTCDRPFSCICRRCEFSHTSVVLSRPAIHNLL